MTTKTAGKPGERVSRVSVGRTALYRYVDDVGVLLYVGVATSPISRLIQHQSEPWFERVANIAVEWFPTRAEALEAEKAAIISERPLHNMIHSKHQAPYIWRERKVCPPDLREVLTRQMARMGVNPSRFGL